MITSRTHGLRLVARASAVLVLQLVASCVYPATVMVVEVGSDAPVDRPLELTVTVLEAGSNRTSVVRWTRGPGAAADGGRRLGALPASFAVVPSAGAPRDQSVTLTIDAYIPPDPNSAQGALTFRRVARFRYLPHQTTRVGVYLPTACAAASTRCGSAVPAFACTRTVECEAQGLTCGDRGECVARELVPSAFDGGGATADAAAVPDLGADAPSADRVAMDAPAPPDAPAACGLAGQPCCGSMCGAGLVCGGGSTCVACGGAGQPCCAGNTCTAPRECRGGNCFLPCGSEGDRCCPSGSCNAGLTCSGGTSCVRCGGAEQPCCAGDACDSGLACMGGACRVVCGAAGQPCCAGSACNTSALVCLTDVCRACGAVGQPCCAGSACSSGATCMGGGCAPCGMVGQLCCSGACVTGSCRFGVCM